MVSSQQRNNTVIFLDLSPAVNSAQAWQLLEQFVLTLHDIPPGTAIDVNAGDLLLTRGVLIKMKQAIVRTGATWGIMYATLPQTQQAALDEGLFVKEKPTPTLPVPIRQSLPGSSATRPPSPSLSGNLPRHNSSSASSDVDLPVFSLGQGRSSAPAKSDAAAAAKEADNTFIAIAPQSTEVRELSPSVPEPEQSFSDASIPSSSTALSDLVDAIESEGAVVKISSHTVTDETLVEEYAESLPTDRAQERQEISFSDTLTDSGLETLYWRHTLRSGQTLRFQGNIVIIGDVHAGSEVIAGGDIVVWGELRGLAHAGGKGSYKAEIRAMRIEALQLRIADYIARRPDRIYYHKEDLESAVSPEVARVADGEIKIFKSKTARLS